MLASVPRGAIVPNFDVEAVRWWRILHVNLETGIEPVLGSDGDGVGVALALPLELLLGPSASLLDGVLLLLQLGLGQFLDPLSHATAYLAEQRLSVALTVNLRRILTAFRSSSW